MSIIIGADIVPTRSNQSLFEQGDAKTLLGEKLVSILSEADFRIANLEAPLCDDFSPIKKIGGALCAPTMCAKGIKSIGIDLVTIANNHIMDHGEKGLTLTVKTLKDAGISYVGAGEDLKTAGIPMFFDVNGKKIGLYACAEHEFSIASEESPGANPVDLINLSDTIFECRSKCDYLIVLYHGGKEYYPYPSPELQKVCRKIVEKGAELVICQHSHCLGSHEEYLNGHIIYGQGNFIFDDGEDECLRTSVLVRISNDWTIDYIPIRKTGNTIKLAEGKEGEEILKGFEERSRNIQKQGFIKQEYIHFADQYRQFYLAKLHGRTIKKKWFRGLNRIMARKLETMVLDRAYTEQERLELQNYIECEAHRELLVAGIKHR